MSEEKKIKSITEHPYKFNECTVNLSVTLVPDDGKEGGRQVIIGARTHKDAPIIRSMRLEDIDWSEVVPEILSELEGQMGERKLAHELKEAEKDKKKSNKKPEAKVKTVKNETGEEVVESSKDGKIPAGQIKMI